MVLDRKLLAHLAIVCLELTLIFHLSSLRAANGELKVIANPNQNSPLMDSLIPLLGIDVWEHAYYLLRGPDRGAYVDAWWDVVDFAPVEQAFEKVAPA